MPRYKLTIEYDGSAFCGWQVQTHDPSVQGFLEDAIEKFCGERTPTICAGRTDSGVHALGQVVHIDLSTDHDPFRVQSALNFHLQPHAIAVVAAEKTHPEFHARFGAVRRHYKYRIINRRAPLTLDVGRAWCVHPALNVAAMRQAAALFVGTHDFTSFRDTQCQAKSPVKTLERLELEQMGDELHLHASAKSFLHHQVRNMVGTLVDVGLGKYPPARITEMLAARDRRAGGPTAPPDGLYLTRVEY